VNPKSVETQNPETQNIEILIPETYTQKQVKLSAPDVEISAQVLMRPELSTQWTTDLFIKSQVARKQFTLRRM